MMTFPLIAACVACFVVFGCLAKVPTLQSTYGEPDFRKFYEFGDGRSVLQDIAILSTGEVLMLTNHYGDSSDETHVTLTAPDGTWVSTNTIAGASYSISRDHNDDLYVPGKKFNKNGNLIYDFELLGLNPDSSIVTNVPHSSDTFVLAGTIHDPSWLLYDFTVGSTVVWGQYSVADGSVTTLHYFEATKSYELVDATMDPQGDLYLVVHAVGESTSKLVKVFSDGGVLYQVEESAPIAAVQVDEHDPNTYTAYTASYVQTPDGTDLVLTHYGVDGVVLAKLTLGGTGNEYPEDMKLVNGFLYVTGRTDSQDFTGSKVEDVISQFLVVVPIDFTSTTAPALVKTVYTFELPITETAYDITTIAVSESGAVYLGGGTGMEFFGESVETQEDAYVIMYPHLSLFTAVPTAAPTSSAAPTEAPTEAPTFTSVPTELPTEAPTEVPTELPTEAPVLMPTAHPSEPFSHFLFNTGPGSTEIIDVAVLSTGKSITLANHYGPYEGDPPLSYAIVRSADGTVEDTILQSDLIYSLVRDYQDNFYVPGKKYDSNGNLIYNFDLGGLITSFSNTQVVLNRASKDVFYVVGTVVNADWHGHSFEPRTVVWAKYNMSTGDVLGAYYYESSIPFSNRDATVDANDNLYLSLNRYRSGAGIIAAYNSNGTKLWEQENHYHINSIQAEIVNGFPEIYVATYKDIEEWLYDVHLIRYDHEGTILSELILGGGGWNYPTRMRLFNNHLYITGETTSKDFTGSNVGDEAYSQFLVVVPTDFTNDTVPTLVTTVYTENFLEYYTEYTVIQVSDAGDVYLGGITDGNFFGEETATDEDSYLIIYPHDAIFPAPPTDAPTEAPTEAPTAVPTQNPTSSQSLRAPTAKPTAADPFEDFFHLSFDKGPGRTVLKAMAVLSSGKIAVISNHYGSDGVTETFAEVKSADSILPESQSTASATYSRSFAGAITSVGLDDQDSIYLPGRKLDSSGNLLYTFTVPGLELEQSKVVVDPHGAKVFYVVGTSRGSKSFWGKGPYHKAKFIQYDEASGEILTSGFYKDAEDSLAYSSFIDATMDSAGTLFQLILNADGMYLVETVQSDSTTSSFKINVGQPYSIEIDSENDIYVASTKKGNLCVTKYDATGKLLGTFTLGGAGVETPIDFKVVGDNLYLTGTSTSQGLTGAVMSDNFIAQFLLVLSKDFTASTKPEYADIIYETNKLNYFHPSGIAVSASKNIFVGGGGAETFHGQSVGTDEDAYVVGYKPTSESTTESLASSSSSSDNLSTGAIVGIAIGGTAFVLIAVAVCLLMNAQFTGRLNKEGGKDEKQKETEMPDHRQDNSMTMV